MSEINVPRLQYFEGKTIEEIGGDFRRDPLKNDLMNEVEEVANWWQTDGVIDDGAETAALSRRLMQRPDFFALIDHPLFRDQPITEEDISQYQRYYWTNQRSAVAQNYQLEDVDHPFVQIFSQLQSWEFDSLRGLPVFETMGERLVADLPQIGEQRSLNVLYPAGGKHVAPLLVAMELMDQDVIDSAQYVYTEIEPSAPEFLIQMLRHMVEAGLIEDLNVGESEFRFLRGSEQKIHFVYRDKSITILYALNRSGDDYYREDYFENSDVIVLHDPGNNSLETSYALLAEMTFQKRKSFESRPQAIVMEGAVPRPYSAYNEGDFNIPTSIRIFTGAYGHCNGEAGVGEIKTCRFGSAISFRLDGEFLQNTEIYRDEFELRQALLPEHSRDEILPRTCR